MTVYPPKEHGMPVYPEEIQNRMKMLKVPETGSRKILDIIEAAEGKPEPLVEWPDGASLASRIETEISEDKMSAHVIIEAPRKGAAPPTTAVDGSTVTGEILPASSDTETIVINAGNNARIEGDGSRLYADIDGNAKIAGNAVMVEPVVTVENVNYETGNIRFGGSEDERVLLARDQLKARSEELRYRIRIQFRGQAPNSV